MRPFWLSAFLDLPGFLALPEDPSVRFWADVSGSTLSPTRGGHAELATLIPRAGDAFLRVQRVRDGAARMHLDLHVSDPRAEADRALSRGAEEVADLGYVVLRSPAGVTFCFVDHPASVVPRAVRSAVGPSRVAGVCVDVPATGFDAEVGFWTDLLGVGTDHFPGTPEFVGLQTPASWPLGVLVQRRTEGQESGIHLDVSAADRPGQVSRHADLGARVVQEGSWWTVLRDPAGSAYCITDRDPETGAVPGS